MSVPGKLGRRLQHDPRSKEFPARGATKLVTTFHSRHLGALDQRDTSMCTGFSMVGCLMTDPLWHRGEKLDRVQAQIIYSRATQLDGLPGEYPPDDVGSSGL